MLVALRPGERWSLDFVSGSFGASHKFRMLAVNDDCCRENLCLMAYTSISGARAGQELDALVRIYGKPAWLSQITSYARNDWLIWHQVIVVSRCLDTFGKWLSSAFWSTTVSPVTNTEYAFAALTVLKTRSSGR